MTHRHTDASEVKSTDMLMHVMCITCTCVFKRE